ncbi:MAG TPA: LCCL domain-containing protein [Acetobacteraceae bacterium]|nr:LCCL domain-containing protein [Acetobacteraceae bacterium]
MPRLHPLAGAALLLALAAPAAAQGPGQLRACPNTFDGFTTRCVCWSPGNGPVWGSGPYAVESAICAAARHAGVIPETGGAVRVVPMPGQPSYRGSYRNGVQSADKGSSQRSFRVERGAEPWGAAPAR